MTGEFPHKGPVTLKISPSDDVIIASDDVIIADQWIHFPVFARVASLTF